MEAISQLLPTLSRNDLQTLKNLVKEQLKHTLIILRPGEHCFTFNPSLIKREEHIDFIILHVSATFSSESRDSCEMHWNFEEFIDEKIGHWINEISLDDYSQFEGKWQDATITYQDQSHWSYGDWDDPTECEGQIEVYLFFHKDNDLANHEGNECYRIYDDDSAELLKCKHGKLQKYKSSQYKEHTGKSALIWVD